MKAAVGAVILQLRDKIGFPYTMVPIDAYMYGGAGIGGWGVLCGAPNGAAAAMNYVLPSRAVVDELCYELLGWYAETSLPSNLHDSYAKYPGQKQSVAGSPLCHASVSIWCRESGFGESSAERKDRCAKLTGDCAAKAVELLNAYFDGKFAKTYKVSATTASCQGCHVGKDSMLDNSLTHMDCTPCHGDPHK